MINKKILLALALFILPIVFAQSYEFELNENINYRFRCLDANNNYCSSGTIVTISIEDPEGINIMDNSSMSGNDTYFNHSLPTNKLGSYKAIIVAPGNANTTTEFTYLVTPTGFDINVIPLQLIILVGGFGIIILGKQLENLKLFKYIGSMLVMVMGILTLYPGYQGIDHTNLLGMAIGFSSIGLGFYFLIEDSFSYDRQVETFQSLDDGRFHA